MDKRTLTELIGLIYDVADDADLWSRIVEILTSEIGSLQTDEENDARAPKKEDIATSKQLDSELIELLQPHLARSMNLNRRLFETSEAHNTMEELLERLPLGVMIVDSEANVLSMNRKLEQIMANGRGITVKNNILRAMTPLNTKKLRDLIREVANEGHRKGKAIDLSLANMTFPLSALILSFKSNSSLNKINRNRVVVLVAAPGTHLEISTETLMALYQLTGAEAKLVAKLVKDHDPNSIAEEFGISKHTIRHQLKAIYAKTGTHRQAELVRQVVTGPAMLSTLTENNDSCVQSMPALKQVPSSSKNDSRHHQAIRLPDKRQLGFAEYGIREGHPIVFMLPQWGLVCSTLPMRAFSKIVT